jgi:hypothetical protein
LGTRLQFYRRKLMWTNKDNGKRIEWAEAKNYCGTLRLGGFSDWRLPSVDELKSISEGKRAFDESVAIYHVKKGVFLSDPSVWSSTEGTGFDFGTEDDIGGRALCVRVDNGQAPTQAPQAPPFPASNQALPASGKPASDQTVQSKASWPDARGAYAAKSSEDIPAFPTVLTGYRSEDGKDFWGKEYPVKGTLRVFQHRSWDAIYPPFPATMNHCSSGAFMIRWRSSSPDVLVRSALGPYTTENIPNVTKLIAQGAAKSPASFGYMYGTNCDQPMFAFDRDLKGDGTNLVDIYYEVKFWEAAP